MFLQVDLSCSVTVGFWSKTLLDNLKKSLVINNNIAYDCKMGWLQQVCARILIQSDILYLIRCKGGLYICADLGALISRCPAFIFYVSFQL